MKKLFFSIGLVVVSAFYVVFANQNSLAITPVVLVTAENTPAATLGTLAGNNPPAAGNNPLPAITSTATQPQTSPPASTPSTVPPSIPPPIQKPKGLYADGAYTGNAANAYYGMVQVKTIIQGGKITDVQFLQHPDTHSTSVYINTQAMPYLTQEAIQAQSANVDIVSGATDTSMAFQQSLASALAQAKN